MRTPLLISVAGIFMCCTATDDDFPGTPHVNDTTIAGRFEESVYPNLSGITHEFFFAADSFSLVEGNWTDLIFCDTGGYCRSPSWTHFYSGIYGVIGRDSISLDGHYDSTVYFTSYLPNYPSWDSAVQIRNRVFSYGNMSEGYILDGSYPYYLNLDTLMIFIDDHQNSKLRSYSDTLLLIEKP